MLIFLSGAFYNLYFLAFTKENKIDKEKLSRELRGDWPAPGFMQLFCRFMKKMVYIQLKLEGVYKPSNKKYHFSWRTNTHVAYSLISKLWNCLRFVYKCNLTLVHCIRPKKKQISVKPLTPWFLTPPTLVSSPIPQKTSYYQEHRLNKWLK